MFTATPSPLLTKERTVHGRRMVAIDIENVVGGAVMTRAHAINARRCVEATVTPRADDHVVVGASHIGAVNAGPSWPSARLVVRSGQDGADLALLDVLTDEHIAERFDELVLVSGDGIFSDAVAKLDARGLRVTVASLSFACAKRLRMAASATRYLASMPLQVGDAA